MLLVRFDTVFADILIVILFIVIVVSFILKSGMEARFLKEFYNYREENRNRKVTLDEMESYMSRYRIIGYEEKIRTYYSYTPDKLKKEYNKSRYRHIISYLMVVALIVSRFI